MSTCYLALGSYYLSAELRRRNRQIALEDRGRANWIDVVNTPGAIVCLRLNW